MRCIVGVIGHLSRPIFPKECQMRKTATILLALILGVPTFSQSSSQSGEKTATTTDQTTLTLPNVDSNRLTDKPSDKSATTLPTVSTDNAETKSGSAATTLSVDARNTGVFKPQVAVLQRENNLGLTQVTFDAKCQQIQPYSTSMGAGYRTEDLKAAIES